MKCYPILAAVCCVLALGACTKEKKTASCTSTLYGYVSPGSTPWSPTASTFFGHIDLSTMATSTSPGAVPNNAYSNQATFNTSDNCYYVFKSGWGWTTDTLLKITIGGSVSQFTNAGGKQYTGGLIYNPVANKFYCVLGGSGSPASIAEVTIAGTSYTVTPVATASGIAYWTSPVTSSVNGMGEMYFAIANAPAGNYSIEQYHPGATSTTVITSGTGAGFLGLRFNPNDNKLYAIKESFSSGSAHEFVSISGGAVTSLSTLPFSVNNEFYSTTLDHCNNRYILSTFSGSPWSTTVVVQLNMSGAVVQTDSTAGLYQGLDILY